MTYLRDKVKNADGSVTEYHIDEHNHKIHIKKTTDLEPQLESNKAEFDVDRRHYVGRDMEKVASIDARALEAHAIKRGVSFRELMADKKEISKFIKENPYWKTRPGRF